ncbi:hypothetical protein ES708_32610 [subsurface metagenome]
MAKKNVVKKKTAKKKTPIERKEKKVPTWALQPFKDSLERLNEAQVILVLAIKGISGIRGIPKIIKVLAEVESETGKLDDEDTKRLKLAKEEADLAQREVDKGFPLLHAQALISLWGILESLVHTFLANWLTHESTAKEIEVVKRIKVKLAEFEVMDSQERNYYIVQTLEQQLAASYKKGILRFETLLDIFGFGGGIDNQVKRDILELQQIRHVLVHRHGVIDKKLKEACPWLHLKVGNKIRVTQKDMRRYSLAVDKYVAELVRRVALHFGKKIDIGTKKL